MKILIVSKSDSTGGAAIAAHRLFEALRSSGVCVEMLVLENNVKDDNDIKSPFSNFQKFVFRIKRKLSSWFVRAVFGKRTGLQSLGFFNSPALSYINNSNADLVNIHWVCDDFLSVDDLAKIKKPVLFTAHDMWLVSAVEHYPIFLDRYKNSSMVPVNAGSFLNRCLLNKKLGLLKQGNCAVVCPSNWLRYEFVDKCSSDQLRIATVMNPIDIDFYYPIDKDEAKIRLGLDTSEPLILFGATGGIGDIRKGGDLLIKIVEAYSKKGAKPVRFGVFGQGRPDTDPFTCCEIKWFGEISDHRLLRTIYSAADVYIFPSRLDNLANCLLESMSCGTGVVCFDTGGNSDLVKHKATGWLSEPYDIQDFIDGIDWCLTNSKAVGSASRDFICCNASDSVIVKRYLQVVDSFLINER